MPPLLPKARCALTTPFHPYLLLGGLRSVVDLKSLSERQITIDCDVIQADGGTRTAAISGAYIALHCALTKLVEAKKLEALPLLHQVAAVSCGIVNGVPVLDLDYGEDSTAQADANFVMTEAGTIIEVQTTAEDKPFEENALFEMMRLARLGIDQITALQQKMLSLL